MKCFFAWFILSIQQVICQNVTEETMLTWSDMQNSTEVTLLTWNDTTIGKNLQLTTSFYSDLNSTADTVDILPFEEINASPLVTHILKKIFRSYEPYCWRHSYGRGIGRPLYTCPDHSPERQGLLCYPSCRDGYNGVGPVCWEKCQNTTSFGFACLDIRLSERSCPWYDKCGLIRSSCVSCPVNYTKLGCLCGRVYFRHSYGRGVGSALTCSTSDEQNGAVCYEKCAQQYTGLGPVCWQRCPSTHPFSCLTGCAKTKEICHDKVADMVQSVIVSSISVLNLVIGVPIITSKTLDILSWAAKADWKIVFKEISMLAEQLTSKILPKIVGNFLHRPSDNMASAIRNASLILTATALKDHRILASIFRFFHFDSINLAFNHGKCELSDNNDLEFL